MKHTKASAPRRYRDYDDEFAKFYGRDRVKMRDAINDTPLVFVYGTLRRGGGANGMMDACVPYGIGELDGYDLFTWGVPGIQPTERLGAKVVGECYVVTNPSDLADLDSYESEGAAYRRTKVWVRLRTPQEDGWAAPANVAGLRVQAWVYEYLGSMDGSQHVENGDWIGSGFGIQRRRPDPLDSPDPWD